MKKQNLSIQLDRLLDSAASAVDERPLPALSVPMEQRILAAWRRARSEELGYDWHEILRVCRRALYLGATTALCALLLVNWTNRSAEDPWQEQLSAVDSSLELAMSR